MVCKVVDEVKTMREFELRYSLYVRMVLIMELDSEDMLEKVGVGACVKGVGRVYAVIRLWIPRIGICHHLEYGGIRIS
jgi:hypothetical protein